MGRAISSGKIMLDPLFNFMDHDQTEMAKNSVKNGVPTLGSKYRISPLETLLSTAD
jgi:hypothetical protein